MGIVERDIPVDEGRAFLRLLHRLRQGEAVDWSSVERECPSVLLQFKGGARTFERLASRRAYWESSVAASGASDLTAGSPPIDLLAQGLPGYDLALEIGRGGQGVVYEAVHRATKRRVAVKLLLEGPLASRAQRDRFLREVELVARFRHPNIVGVYETGTVLGHPFFVMEFVDGLPIDDYALLHELCIRDAVSLFCKVCDAVSHAQQRGVIHRDLKPTNILVDASGEPRILDFGLAKDLAEPGSGQTVTGQLLGTLAYSAPEQLSGAADDVDVRTDVYALGLVLFRTLTGSFPYPAMGPPREAMEAIVAQSPKGLRKAVAELPPEFRRIEGLNKDIELIVDKALAKEKERRYQSAAALAEDLRHYLAGEAVSARSGHNLYYLAKAVRRFRVPAAIAAVIALVVVASLISVTAAWRKQAEVARLAQSGLNQAALLRLAQVERDMGRVDHAIQLARTASDVAKGQPQDDPVLRRVVFQIHYTLGDLLLTEKNVEEARVHSAAASAMAAGLLAQDPEDPDLQRDVAFSWFLNGKVAAEAGDSADGLSESARAERLFRTFAGAQPAIDRHRYDLALTLFWKGKCQARLEQLDAARTTYAEAHSLLSDVYKANPTNAAYAIQLARTEAVTGSLYLHKKLPARPAEALELFQAAESRLIQIQSTPAGNELAGDIEPLLEAIRLGKGKAEKRLSQSELARHERSPTGHGG